MDRKKGTGVLDKALPGPNPNVARKHASSTRKALLLSAVFGAIYLSYGHLTAQEGISNNSVLHRKRPLKGRDAEKLFLSVPDEESALATSRIYATHPHLAGSSEDLQDAKGILELFQTEFGVEAPSKLPVFSAGTSESRNATLHITSSSRPNAWIDKYYPVMNTPLDRSLQILGKDGSVEWNADLVEDGDPRDPEAGEYRDYVPTFHGLSKDGDVEGKLIYGNYCTREDYQELESKGVDLFGTIVLCRYGANFRGIKIQLAQERGASGVLIYSDTRDDGVVTVENGYETYPGGPARNPTSVQRGSVQYLAMYPGDPTTPGTPAYENATRTDGENIPKIPSLPISWNNAKVLLEEIGGLDEGRTLSGKLSDKTIKLVNHVDTRVIPIWNTMASIPGHIRDEVVVIGCHRDAWVMGAADPTSGTVSLFEIVRGFGHLLRSGWKPLRTVVFASWDAEEYGLIGSTEWGEDFSDWIGANVVAYLQIDVSVGGSRWNAGASPSLAHLIRATAQEIPHPTDKHRTLWDAGEDIGPYDGSAADADFMANFAAAEERRAANKDSVGILSPLGSGSDFTVFLQRIGIASCDQGFGGTPYDAVYHYHSIYDSQHWQEHFADEGFHRHVAVSKHLGLLALRVIDSIILPLNTTQYVLELHSYLDEVEEIASDSSLHTDLSSLRESIKELEAASRALDYEKAEAEENFKKLLKKLPGGDGVCRDLPFRRVREWIKAVFGVHPSPPEVADDAYLQLLGPDAEVSHGHNGTPIEEFIKAAKRVRKDNQKLQAFEQGFISEEGIKDREWYKHLGVAPGKYLGYGATTFPALTEAITIEKNETLVKYESKRLKNLLDKLTEHLLA
ncbi:Zn-dependent exopeptidase [Punctularia strigosozonata HHB-11173 SS5]|uniref:Zn-dependent exopeptidase n=1 Tax=Punctularia strigosozonata (strain HHB-11173) TaxID=741275 RepID=UPI0004417A17|nr:Zn-dependent exopeptidase [Punctularia strigosozonata HHB-11173 SS5]EIN10533.1 Zn-dependent exopeptidase [Punctularia strigosozonata HHB-11173 SS5]